MKTSLIYPPTCDPTAPYLSLPALSAYLRHHGINVLPIDANVEGYDRLLRRAFLLEMAARITKRFARLNRKTSLSHTEKLLYGRLRQATPYTVWVPDAVEDAVSVMRDRAGSRFFDPHHYEKAMETIQAALLIISAAYSPLSMDFKSYRTPFSLLTPEQIRADADPDKNPFHDYFAGELQEQLKHHTPQLIGISMAFPGQIQPGFSLAYLLRRTFPETHITMGGPAVTQLFAHHPQEKIPDLLGPFDSVVLFEGEAALLNLADMLSKGNTPPRVIHGPKNTDLDRLPPPDFDGMPLNKYLSPEVVFPYDPTRGCYWGKCAFCHYGLSPKGTAMYRKRSVRRIVEDLLLLEDRWGCRIVYFSQDAFDHRTAAGLSRELLKSGTDIRWASDMRPEPILTREYCRDLKAGGALSLALGIESASPRMLQLIDKGIAVNDMRDAVKNLSEAGIAVEGMLFSDFPTETYADADATIAFIREMRGHLALFILGQFSLGYGSRVAQRPEDFGVQQTWYLAGDTLQTGLFYEERLAAKSDAERRKLDRAVEALSAGWWLHDYPWAGALSTAHTLLWYARYGPEVFRRFAGISRQQAAGWKSTRQPKRFHGDRMIREAEAREEEIWRRMVYDHKTVSPARYRQLCKEHGS